MFKIPRFRFQRMTHQVCCFSANNHRLGRTDGEKQEAGTIVHRQNKIGFWQYSGCKIGECDVTSKYRACKSGWSSVFVATCLMCALLLTNKYCPFMMLFTGAIPVARQQFRHDKFWGLINARAMVVHWVRLGIMGISWVISELSVNTNVFLSSEYHPPNTRVITLV